MASFYELRHYIAHQLNRGQKLCDASGQCHSFDGRVYDSHGNYSEAFSRMVEAMLRSGALHTLHFEADRFALVELMQPQFKFDYRIRCQRCRTEPYSRGLPNSESIRARRGNDRPTTLV